MKNIKKLTRKLKLELSKKKYDPSEWGILSEKGSKLVLINKRTNEKLEVDK